MYRQLNEPILKLFDIDIKFPQFGEEKVDSLLCE